MPTVLGVILALDERSIKVEGDRIGVAKYHPTTGLGNRLGGGNPGMRPGDDFITWLQTQPAHGDIEGVRTIGAGHTMLHAHRRGPRLLKGVNVRSANESGLGDDVRKGGVNLRFDGEVLSVEVNELDFHGLVFS